VNYWAGRNDCQDLLLAIWMVPFLFLAVLGSEPRVFSMLVNSLKGALPPHILRQWLLLFFFSGPVDQTQGLAHGRQVLYYWTTSLAKILVSLISRYILFLPFWYCDFDLHFPYDSDLFMCLFAIWISFSVKCLFFFCLFCIWVLYII
jgi:hypothetical protein